MPGAVGRTRPGPARPPTEAPALGPGTAASTGPAGFGARAGPWNLALQTSLLQMRPGPGPGRDLGVHDGRDPRPARCAREPLAQEVTGRAFPGPASAWPAYGDLSPRVMVCAVLSRPAECLPSLPLSTLASGPARRGVTCPRQRLEISVCTPATQSSHDQIVLPPGYRATPVLTICETLTDPSPHSRPRNADRRPQVGTHHHLNVPQNAFCPRTQYWDRLKVTQQCCQASAPVLDPLCHFTVHLALATIHVSVASRYPV